MMNIYLVIILAILITEYLLDLIVENLNLRQLRTTLPEEFKDCFDSEKYSQSQNYLKDRTCFGLLKSTLLTTVFIAVILMGGFNYLDMFARSFNAGYIVTGLIFAASCLFSLQLINLPFSIYHTFVLEEKYGFNRTTVTTFVLDLLKSWFLVALIAGVMFTVIIWFFTKIPSAAWIYCWIGVTLFQIFLLFITPVVIMPLFNKFIPLEEGRLRAEIEQYARQQNFKLKGIFKIDASRRSSKSNAFFTGFGKYKRIALFDTLIAKLIPTELVSVLAHEVGHYKKRHIIKGMLLSIFTTGIMFFILSLFLENPGLFAAFKMEQTSIYASLFFFGFLYSPISMFFSVFSCFVSRRHEFAADLFAVNTYRRSEDFIMALKKLTVANLSNLTPHPLKVFLQYSHPPVLQRIKTIREKVKTIS